MGVKQYQFHFGRKIHRGNLKAFMTNLKNGQRTLCLLDIKVKERSVENMMRGKNIFEPARFMTTQQAAKQLIEVIRNRKLAPQELNQTAQANGTDEPQKHCLDENTVCIAAARIGSEDQKLVATNLQRL